MDKKKEVEWEKPWSNKEKIEPESSGISPTGTETKSSVPPWIHEQKATRSQLTSIVVTQDQYMLLQWMYLQMLSKRTSPGKRITRTMIVRAMLSILEDIAAELDLSNVYDEVDLRDRILRKLKEKLCQK